MMERRRKVKIVTGDEKESNAPCAADHIPRRPVLPKAFAANQPQTIRLYPLSNYTFGTKDTQPEEDPSVIARLKRLEEHYEQHGMRRTCEGILVCHEHNHPHVLMLQIANAFFKLCVLRSLSFLLSRLVFFRSLSPHGQLTSYNQTG
jgi:hypothetical protein